MIALGVHRNTLHTSRSQVQPFNKTSVKETVQKHNDPIDSDWNLPADSKYVTGHEAIMAEGLKRTWPLNFGMVNWDEYSSWHEWEADVACIWRDALQTELGMADFEVGTLNVNGFSSYMRGRRFRLCW